MPLVEQRKTGIIEKEVNISPDCYHCGAGCLALNIIIGGKYFCCEGCKLVYEIIEQNGLCDYYRLQEHPGLSRVKPLISDKYTFLDNDSIAEKLYSFSDGDYTIVTFYVPGIHCSSCMWLLEHLPALHKGIRESRLNFSKKEVTVHFSKKMVSMKHIVDLMATIGYEPRISLRDTEERKATHVDRTKIYKIGIAGFCFGNIMMMSFPEYLAGELGIGVEYTHLFRYLNLLLSLPVFFYSASEFFSSAWSGLRQKYLNIDAPIALALMITFTRSIYEIITGIGSGYLDSMTGIVFFMLVGRIVQERTYKFLSFHRDYRSYFPVAVKVITEHGIESRTIGDLKPEDIVQLHNEEIIPADAALITGDANIDYSFVTGESDPVTVEPGRKIYAGGRQQGGKITIRILKPVDSSYLTSLWNHYSFHTNKQELNGKQSIIHIISKYFTVILFTLTAITAIYWTVVDPAKILASVSAMLIVACPCALLLSATYTNGNLLRIFSNNGLFLRDASVIEQLGQTDHIVFDKTGTLTTGKSVCTFTGYEPGAEERGLIRTVLESSSHPYSRIIAGQMGTSSAAIIDQWQEYPGLGIKANIQGNVIMVGKASFVNTADTQASAYIRFNKYVTACHIQPHFRDSIPEVIPKLAQHYELSLLSGDNDKHAPALRTLFTPDNVLLFSQHPLDKLHYIQHLQQRGRKVLMVGDGLNDAGALQQSNAGITLADNVNNFVPSCDAILDAAKFDALPSLLKLARYGGLIINVSFIISILYNIAGLTLSMQGKMNPMTAAILMPASTLSIVLVTTGCTNLAAKWLGLSFNGNNS